MYIFLKPLYLNVILQSMISILKICLLVNWPVDWELYWIKEINSRSHLYLFISAFIYKYLLKTGLLPAESLVELITVQYLLCSDLPHLSSEQRRRAEETPVPPGTRSPTSGPWTGRLAVRVGLHSHLLRENRSLKFKAFWPLNDWKPRSFYLLFVLYSFI